MPRCIECQGKGLIGGSAFTNYICGECGIEAIWHNTNHPKLCPECMKKAQTENRCIWCGKDIDG